MDISYRHGYPGCSSAQALECNVRQGRRRRNERKVTVVLTAWTSELSGRVAPRVTVLHKTISMDISFPHNWKAHRRPSVTSPRPRVMSMQVHHAGPHLPTDHVLYRFEQHLHRSENENPRISATMSVDAEHLMQYF